MRNGKWEKRSDGKRLKIKRLEIKIFMYKNPKLGCLKCNLRIIDFKEYYMFALSKCLII